MNSDLRNSETFSAHALRDTAHCRTFVIALLLATIGGVTSTVLAQAAPKGNGAYLFLWGGDSGLNRVCVGDSVIFSVIAEPSWIGDVTINGSVWDNSGYGILSPVTSKTSTASTPAGSAVFTFRALRPGTMQLRFTGLRVAARLNSPGRTYAPVTRDVFIVSCESLPQSTGAPGSAPAVLKNRKDEGKSSKRTTISQVMVTSISTWSAGMVIVATIKDAVMDADDQGHFTGSSDVTWQTSVIGGPGCGAAEYAISPSKAELSGDLDGSNQLVVKITFQPKEFAGFATCGQSISTSNVGAPDPLIITVAATGGSSTQPHAVTAKNGSFIGSATTVVSRERR